MQAPSRVPALGPTPVPALRSDADPSDERRAKPYASEAASVGVAGVRGRAGP